MAKIGTDFLIYPVVIRAGKDKPAANTTGLTVGTGSADSGQRLGNNSWSRTGATGRTSVTGLESHVLKLGGSVTNWIGTEGSTESTLGAVITFITGRGKHSGWVGLTES